jgi:uncharacterized protein
MVGKRIGFLAFVILAVLCLAFPVCAAKNFLVDQANVFTEEQAASLAEKAGQLGEQYAMDIVIVTVDDTGGKSSRDYADDYFDYNGYGVGVNRDGILFLIDFDNRNAYISTSGSGIRYLTDERISSILDDVFNNGMTDGNYYSAAQTFLNSTATFLAAGIPSDQHNEPETSNTLSVLDGVLGLLASGGLGAGIFAGTKRSYKGKAQRSIFNFRNNSLVDLGVISDPVFNSFVTSRIIPRNTSSGSSFGGRSTTHTSSSGGTHGGGGRSF